MPQTNATLSKAKKEKNAEFYTQLTDIEKELVHYEKHFKNKVIFCNCDDPFESNFFKYFVLNFNRLGLKKLITTSYVSSSVRGKEYEPGFAKPYKAIVTTVHDATGDGAISMEDIKRLFELKENELMELKGDGDFRSNEAIECLKEADIVVTNPPFPLFREYIAQLMEYNKKFIIIGNMNVITYKEFFPLLKDNKVWLGYHSGHTLFAVPDTYDVPDFYNLNDKQKLRSNGYVFDENGKLWRNLGNICWFTNLDIKKRHEELVLIKKYLDEDYPKYDNYDAIEVSKVINIPYNYDGIMGVPITFLDKYNPEQFEIIGLDRYTVPKEFLVGGRIAIGGKPRYARILIRNKHPEK